MFFSLVFVAIAGVRVLLLRQCPKRFRGCVYRVPIAVALLVSQDWVPVPDYYLIPKARKGTDQS